MSSSQNIPSEPPPPYTGPPASTSTNNATSNSHTTNATTPSATLQVPKARNGIPPHARRSMEDESRSLPPNWVRQYDSETHHQFFVDTSVSPPRSIWHHPYDDEIYLSSLSPAERERVKNLHELPEDEGSSADERDDGHGSGHPPLPPRTQGASDGGEKTFGRKIKDKLTHTTHAERAAERRRRDEQEAATYRRHQHIRAQMSKAAQTGVPQFLGKDREGHDIYIEPPGGPGGYGAGGMGGFGRMGGGRYAGGNGYGYNPYSQGPYSDPNAKFVRPQQPYARPYPGYGYGYGGGYGMPLLGLGGGMLLGGLIF